MTWNAKCKVVIVAIVALTNFSLLAMLFLGTSPQSIAGNYNRNAAEAYADRWTCNNCAEPHNPEYNYYPGNDCTNFVSQVLHEGGYPYRGCCWMFWNLSYWYHAGKDSYTWAGTPHINCYFSRYPSEFEYKAWPTQLSKGDILLCDFPDQQGNRDNIPDHAAVIVGDNGGLRDQHTPPRKRVAWDAYMPPGTAYWSVHVKW
jgi:hypothetical protein